MTYSIVARDPATGQMGVAVQSHWFSVGSVVSWGEAGVGVVATQAMAEVAHGPRGLELMRAGASATDALKRSLEADEGAALRQVAMVDAAGDVAAHTGARCIAEAGHTIGEAFSAQANMMERATVWDAMAGAYSSVRGDLAERLLVALEAAEAEGGDIRGRQSAAILIVNGEATGDVWRDRALDLRVEDHAEPLKELRRLIGLRRAYEQMNEADERLATNDVDGAGALYQGARATLGANPEATFWAALSFAQRGHADRAREMLAPVFAADARWAELLRRLPASGLVEAPIVEDLLR